MRPLRDKYGLTLSVSIGYDQLGRLGGMAPYVDYFYLQLYDFYTKSVSGIDKTSQSPFLIHRDDPPALTKFIDQEVLSAVPNLKNVYSQYAKQIMIMWSGQNMSGTNCLYPLNGNCGANHEFGLWKADKFNDFLRTNNLFQNVAGVGLFEFDLIPAQWRTS